MNIHPKFHPCSYFFNVQGLYFFCHVHVAPSQCHAFSFHVHWMTEMQEHGLYLRPVYNKAKGSTCETLACSPAAHAAVSV